MTACAVCALQFSLDWPLRRPSVHSFNISFNGSGRSGRSIASEYGANYLRPMRTLSNLISHSILNDFFDVCCFAEEKSTSNLLNIDPNTLGASIHRLALFVLEFWQMSHHMLVCGWHATEKGIVSGRYPRESNEYLDGEQHKKKTHCRLNAKYQTHVVQIEAIVWRLEIASHSSN